MQVGRESGTVQRYSLPHVALAARYWAATESKQMVPEAQSALLVPASERLCAGAGLEELRVDWLLGDATLPKLNEKKTLKVTAQSELKDLTSRIDILTTRLEKVKDEEKKTVEKEISSLKSEITRYEKIIEGYTTEITTIQSTIKTIYTTWTTYYTYYIKVRAETSNSLQVSRQIERTSINRIRRRNHRHSHKHRVIQIK